MRGIIASLDLSFIVFKLRLVADTTETTERLYPADEREAIVEALKLQDSANVAVEKLESLVSSLEKNASDLTFEPTDAVVAWSNEIKEAEHIITKRNCSEHSKSFNPTVIIDAINHRTRSTCAVAAMILADGELPLSLLLGHDYDAFQEGTLSDADAEKMIIDSLRRASDAVQVGTYITESFLLMPDAYNVDISEIGSTLAGFIHVKFSSTLSPSESEIINSPVANPFWIAAMEEIIWNAMKYGANEVRVWKEDGFYCFGNNGIPLTDEQVAEVSGGGVRLYENVEGSGQGINLIRKMGFEYSLGQATPKEQTLYGVNTVVRIKPIEAEQVESIITQSP